MIGTLPGGAMLQHTASSWPTPICSCGLLTYLRENGVGASVHYPLPVHLQPAYKDLNRPKGSYPISEAIAESVISLPIYPEMTNAQINEVVDAVKSFLDQESGES